MNGDTFFRSEFLARPQSNYYSTIPWSQVMTAKIFPIARGVFALSLIILFQKSSYAQGAFFAASVGYGLSAGSQQLESKSDGTNREGVYGSFGQGLKFGATGGYMFSQHVGAELGLVYLIGTSAEGGSTGTSSSTDKRSGSGFMLAPAVVIAGTGTVAPYAKAGIVLGFLKVKNESSGTFAQGQTQSRFESTEEETGGVAIGYTGGVGAVFSGGSQLSFFAEVVLVSIAFSPSQIELTKATLDGKDVLSQITNKKDDYKDSYSTTEQNVRAGVREPFGSVGVNVGVRVNL